MTQSFVKQSILALLVLTLGGSYQSAKATTVKIYCPNPDAMNIVNHVGAGWTYTGDFEYHDVTKGPDSLLVPVTSHPVNSFGAAAKFKDVLVQYDFNDPKKVAIDCEYDFGNQSNAQMTLIYTRELDTEKLAKSCRPTKSNCQSSNNHYLSCYVYCSAEDLTHAPKP